MKILFGCAAAIAVLLFLGDRFMQWWIRTHEENEIEQHRQDGWFFKDK